MGGAGGNCRCAKVQGAEQIGACLGTEVTGCVGCGLAALAAPCFGCGCATTVRQNSADPAILAMQKCCLCLPRSEQLYSSVGSQQKFKNTLTPCPTGLAQNA